MLASFFERCGEHLVIEFVPKSDPQVKLMLSSRLDIFDDYTELAFEEVFARRFRINAAVQLIDSSRKLYSMTRRHR